MKIKLTPAGAIITMLLVLYLVGSCSCTAIPRPNGEVFYVEVVYTDGTKDTIVYKGARHTKFKVEHIHSSTDSDFYLMSWNEAWPSKARIIKRGVTNCKVLE